MRKFFRAFWLETVEAIERKKCSRSGTVPSAERKTKKAFGLIRQEYLPTRRHELYMKASAEFSEF